jgi:hypothetical protein
MLMLPDRIYGSNRFDLTFNITTFLSNDISHVFHSMGANIETFDRMYIDNSDGNCLPGPGIRKLHLRHVELIISGRVYTSTLPMVTSVPGSSEAGRYGSSDMHYDPNFLA